MNKNIFVVLRIDLAILSFIMIINTFALFTIIGALFIQIPLGAYQMLSSLFYLFFPIPDPHIKLLRKWHFFGSLTYVMTIIPFVTNTWDESAYFLILLFVLPQIIAYFYFYVAIRDYQSRSKIFSGAQNVDAEEL